MFPSSKRSTNFAAFFALRHISITRSSGIDAAGALWIRPLVLPLGTPLADPFERCFFSASSSRNSASILSWSGERLDIYRLPSHAEEAVLAVDLTVADLLPVLTLAGRD